MLDERINARFGTAQQPSFGSADMNTQSIPTSLLPPLGTPVLGAIACPPDGQTPCIAAPKPKEVIEVTCSATPHVRVPFWDTPTVIIAAVIGILLVFIAVTLIRNRRLAKSLHQRPNNSNESSAKDDSSNKNNQRSIASAL